MTEDFAAAVRQVADAVEEMQGGRTLTEEELVLVGHLFVRYCIAPPHARRVYETLRADY